MHKSEEWGEWLSSNVKMEKPDKSSSKIVDLRIKCFTSYQKNQSLVLPRIFGVFFLANTEPGCFYENNFAVFV